MASNVVGKVLDHHAQVALEIALSGIAGYAWNDAGSGAHQNVGFWDMGVRGFWPLGSYAQASHDAPDTAMVLVRPVQPDAVAPPIDWTLVWNDEASDANEAGSIWTPVPPPGYAALGTVAKRGREKPAVGLVGGIACVRNDLVVTAQVGPRIWEDHGSGAKRDVSVHAILPHTPDPASPVIYLTSGSFCAFPTYDESKMTTSPAANALLVLRNFEPRAIQPSAPTLTGVSRPEGPIMPDGPTSVIQLPCLLVRDPRYGGNVQRQVEETPFYNLEKYAVYNPDSFMVNNGPRDAELTFSQTTGISETTSRAISETIGIAVTTEVSTQAGVPEVGSVGASVAITASYALGILNQTDRTWYKESTHERKFVVPAYGAGCLFTLGYLYRLKRQDGSEVKNWTVQTPDTAFAAYAQGRTQTTTDAPSVV